MSTNERPREGRGRRKQTGSGDRLRITKTEIRTATLLSHVRTLRWSADDICVNPGATGAENMSWVMKPSNMGEHDGRDCCEHHERPMGEGVLSAGVREHDQADGGEPGEYKAEDHREHCRGPCGPPGRERESRGELGVAESYSPAGGQREDEVEDRCADASERRLDQPVERARG